MKDDLPAGEPFPGETLLAAGWQYRDFQPMLAKFWDHLLSIMGVGNYRLLTEMQRTFKDDPRLFKRGQMLISPEGFRRIRKHVAAGNKYPAGEGAV